MQAYFMCINIILLILFIYHIITPVYVRDNKLPGVSGELPRPPAQATCNCYYLGLNNINKSKVITHWITIFLLYVIFANIYLLFFSDIYILVCAENTVSPYNNN